MPASSPSNDPPSSTLRSLCARWRTLSWRDKRRMFALLLLLPMIHLALAMFRFQRVRGWLDRASTIRAAVACTPAEMADAERLAELASIAGRRGAIAASCLRQSLVVWWWLRRRGLPAQLRIGTLGSGASFTAHAWVELEGVALAQPDLQHRSIESL